MPDIAMCNNDDCPSAGVCHRHEAIPSEYLQAYGSFKPPDGEDNCTHFWKIEDDLEESQ